MTVVTGDDFEDEISTRNWMCVYYIFAIKNQIFVLMELAQGGDLLDLLKGFISEQKA